MANTTPPAAHNDMPKIQAAAIIERLIEGLKNSEIKNRVIDINVDVDIDGNIQQLQQESLSG
jgi:hypothetical protein